MSVPSCLHVNRSGSGLKPATADQYQAASVTGSTNTSILDPEGISIVATVSYNSDGLNIHEFPEDAMTNFGRQCLQCWFWLGDDWM